MKRKAYSKLLNWKHLRNGECALLVSGARRVGKSYLVKQFAQREYRSYILIDFNQTSEQIKNLFDNYLDNLDTLFMYLSAFERKRARSAISAGIFALPSSMPLSP